MRSELHAREVPELDQHRLLDPAACSCAGTAHVQPVEAGGELRRVDLCFVGRTHGRKDAATNWPLNAVVGCDVPVGPGMPRLGRASCLCPVSASRRRNAKAFDRRYDWRSPLLCAVASVALAANVYTVRSAAPSRRARARRSKPIPTGSSSASRSRTSDPSKRGTSIEQYAIGSEGLVTYPKYFPKCTFTQANLTAHRPDQLQEGQGRSRASCKNAAGPAHRPTVSSRSRSSPCNLSCGSTTNGDGMAHAPGQRSASRPPLELRVDTTIGCPTPDRTARSTASSCKTKIGGVTVGRLRFTVPPEPAAPAVRARQLGPRRRSTRS